MRKIFAALVAMVAATISMSAGAGPLPAGTTIYIGVGVRDTGGVQSDSGTSTTFMCTNGSDLTANIRIAIFHATGPLAGSLTFTLAHGRSWTGATRATAAFFDFAQITGNKILE